MIGLSPLSWGHPLRFQPKWVRPSTGSYPRFSLPQDSSPGFASAACDSLAILKARFRCGSFPNLTSPHTATRWLILQKARRHSAKAAPTACGRTVSGTVSLPSRGAFHLSLTVLVRYRSQESVQPWRVVPPASDRVSRARPYSGYSSAVRMVSRTGLSPAAAGPSMPFRYHVDLQPLPGGQHLDASPATPGRQRLPLTRARVWAGALSLAATRAISVDFSSSGYLDVSVPPVASLRPILFRRG